jgi:hypothetical protein
MGMSMHDRYYEQPDDDGEEIQERIDYEMKNKNNPYTKDNIWECMSDDGLIPHLETLATLLSQGDTAAAGTVLSSALYTYWEDRTTKEVLDNL